MVGREMVNKSFKLAKMSGPVWLPPFLDILEVLASSLHAIWSNRILHLSMIFLDRLCPQLYKQKENEVEMTSFKHFIGCSSYLRWCSLAKFTQNFEKIKCQRYFIYLYTIAESVCCNDFGKISRISVKMFKSYGQISDVIKLGPFGT